MSNGKGIDQKIVTKEDEVAVDKTVAGFAEINPSQKSAMGFPITEKKIEKEKEKRSIAETAKETALTGLKETKKEDRVIQADKQLNTKIYKIIEL